MKFVALLQMRDDDGKRDKADGQMSALIDETRLHSEELQRKTNCR